MHITLLKAFCKKIILAFVIFLVLPATLFSQSHVGGEISWNVLPNGRFQFVLKYYYNCHSSLAPPNQVNINSNSPVNSLVLHLVQSQEVSPNCASDSMLSHISCSSSINGFIGAVKELVYTTDLTYPNGVLLTGVPPSTGWEFWYRSWSSRLIANNMNTGQASSFYVRAKMYPFGQQSFYPSFDNSPQFESSAFVIIPAGSFFTYHPRTIDKEMDSLDFSWGEIKGYNGQNLNFSAGFSYLNPLPGVAHNPSNIPATIHPNTGAISFKSYTSGVYLANQKVKVFKCGVKVAEIYRDMVFVIVSDTSSKPPVLISSTEQFTDTLYPGQHLHVDFTLLDTELQTNLDSQQVSFEYFGSQFGNYIAGSATSQPTLSTSVGCINPPCASLTPASTKASPIQQPTSLTYSLDWQTACNTPWSSIYCGAPEYVNKYDFVFKITDDFCPVPAYTYKTYTVILQPFPWIDYPEINRISCDSGAVLLAWNPVIDSLNIFDKYWIGFNDTMNGVDKWLDSTQVLSYLDSTPIAYQRPVSYYIFPKGIACSPFDSLKHSQAQYSSMYLTLKKLSTDFSKLEWNPIQSWKPLLSHQYYYIFRKTTTNPYWQIIDSTKLTNYIDSTHFCDDSVHYKVALRIETKNGPSQYLSFSNTQNIYHKDNFSPIACNTLDVNIISASGNAEVIWRRSNDIDFYYYILYKLGITYFPLDTIFGVNDTVYLDSTSTLSNLADSSFYRVAVADLCGNLSVLGTYDGGLEKQIESQLYLFPNPASNMISIYAKTNDGLPTKAVFKMFSLTGQLVFIKDLILKPGNNDISIIGISQGIYYYQIIGGNSINTTGKLNITSN
jgi:hypothetical protein